MIIYIEGSDEQADWIKANGARERELASWDEMESLLSKKGGPGSGNYGHAGRPGIQGGSQTNKVGKLTDLQIHSSSAETLLAAGIGQPFKTAEELRARFIQQGKGIASEIDALKKQRQNVAKTLKATMKNWNNSPTGLNERLGLRQEHKLLGKKIDATEKQQRKVLTDMIMGMSLEKHAELTPVPSKEFSPEQAADVSSTILTLASFVGSKVGGPGDVYLQPSHSDAGHFSEGTDTIFVAPFRGESASKVTQQVVVHEFGHWLDLHVPGAEDRTRQFFEKRTQGLEMKVQKISKAQDAKEYAIITDKFVDPYTGRFYKWAGQSKWTGGAETLSTGLALLFSKPYEFAKRDSEHFNLTVSILAGVPEK